MNAESVSKWMVSILSRGLVGSCALVTPLLTKGSIPAPRLARMFVFNKPISDATQIIDDGKGTPRAWIVGTIGGGAVELAAVNRGLEVIQTSKPQVAEFDLDGKEPLTLSSSSDAGSIIVPVCGGSLSVLCEPLAQCADLLGKAGDAVAHNTPTVECIMSELNKSDGSVRRSVVHRSSSGAWNVLGGSLGHEEADTLALEIAGDVFMKGKRRVVNFPNDDADKSFVAIPLSVRPCVYIFGGGHVGTATASMAAQCGFRVVVLDDRPMEDSFPFVDEFIWVKECCEDDKCKGWAATAAALPWNAQSFAVIVTHGHVADFDVLVEVLRHPAAYVGLIGSRRKKKMVIDGLKREGFKDEDIDRVRNPIGLLLGGDTPGEIALGIVAEMVAVRYGTIDGFVSHSSRPSQKN